MSHLALRWESSELDCTGLNKREIIVQRHLSESPVTLENLSQQRGISRERVRQIEVCAFDKLRRAVRNLAIEQQVETAKAGQDAAY